MNAERAKRFPRQAIFFAGASREIAMTSFAKRNLCRIDVAAPYRAQGLSAPPVAAHVRHDHGAARPIFLNVGGVAFPHRVRTGIVVGIDVVRFVVRYNPQPGRRPVRLARRRVRRQSPAPGGPRTARFARCAPTLQRRPPAPLPSPPRPIRIMTPHLKLFSKLFLTSALAFAARLFSQNRDALSRNTR